MNYIYVPEKGFHLTERYLQEVGEAPTTLLCHPAKIKWCEELKQKNSSIKSVSTITEQLDGEAKSFENDCVVLPISVGLLKLKFVPRAEIPDLKPYYDEIESLHRLGFRNFRLYTLFGSRELKIEQLLYNFENIHAGKIGIVVANGLASAASILANCKIM